jgi:2-methylcitrate dehydratase PrpD
MAMIKVTVDDAIEALLPDMALRVVAMTHDGGRHVVEVGNPLGHPNNPMRDEHVGEKFTALARPVIGDRRSADTLAQWWRVSDATDVRPLIRLLDLAV